MWSTNGGGSATRGLVANVAGLLCVRYGESPLGAKENTSESLVASFDRIIVVLMFVRERVEKNTWGSMVEWALECCKLSNAGLMFP